jgi:hypothetical protein
VRAEPIALLRGRIDVPSQRTTHAKLQRDRAKKAKAESKRSRRHDRSADAPVEGTGTGTGVGAGPSEPGGEVSAAALLRSVEEAHQQLQSGEITFEEFEERKADLLGRLPIE